MKKQLDGLSIRYTNQEDSKPLKNWLLEKDVLKGFPMHDEKEVDDAVKHWMSFSRYKASLTATVNDEPVGMATLCLMPYKKIAHQCLLSIIVTEKMRNKGVGAYLINNLLYLARDYFALEVIYLEVYAGNAAISLYKRYGFKEVGEQPCFMKENNQYISKIIMERIL